MKQTMRLFLLLLATILLPFTTLNAQSVWDGSVAESFAGGTGTQDDPYLIEDGSQLAYLAKITNENPSVTEGKYYKLIDDIVLNDDVLNDNYELIGTPANAWTPIADVTANSMGNSFKGDFDGDGHTISGVYCVKTSGNYPYTGLFGSIGNNAVVHDLAVVDSYSECIYTCGIITANMTNTSVVRRCYADGRLAGRGSYAGLVVGTMTNGMSCLVEYCYSKGVNTCSYNAAGGIAGYTSSNNSVRYCFSLVDVRLTLMGAGSCVGGVIGQDNGHGEFAHLYFDQTILPDFSVGYQNTYENCSGKTTEEMQSEEFAQLLGEPFRYASGNYPYVEGLPKVGDTSSYPATAHHLKIGTIVNGKGSSIKYFRKYDGTDVSKPVSRAEAGDTVYLQFSFYRHMFLEEEGLVVTDAAGIAVRLTPVADGIWSFLMPESDATASASLYRDPDAPIVWDGSVAESFSGGTGTEEDPYLISSGEELAYLAKITNENGNQTSGVYYKLTEDIYLNEEVLTEDFYLNGTPENVFTPIGCTSNNKFRGHFDGDFHIISGAYTLLPNSAYVGFFNYVENATICNLSMVDSYVKGGQAGVLVCQALNTTISQCYVEGYSDAPTYSSLLACMVNNNTLIENCYISGRITENSDRPGSFCAWFENSNIRNCFSTAYSPHPIDEIKNINAIDKVYECSDFGSKFTGHATFSNLAKEQMLSKEFADHLGEPFHYMEGHYPYIEGLAMVGERTATKTSGYRIKVGEMTNGKRSNIRFYCEYDGMELKSPTNRMEAGETVYMKLTIRPYMLLEDGSLKLINDATGDNIALTSVADSIWSFRMPESSVTATASFYRDPDKTIVWDGTTAWEFAGGTGTKDDPYLISDGDELALLAKLTNYDANKTKDVYYKLTEDIHLNEPLLDENYELLGTPQNTWTPIADTQYSGRIAFQGDFDGNGHVISGLYYVTEASQHYAALFGVIAENASIHDLSLIDSYVKGGYSTALIAGGVMNNAVVRRCYANGRVTGTGGYAGIIAGSLDNKGNLIIEHCYTGGLNDNPGNAGGLVGYAGAGTIRNSFATVYIPTSSNSYRGGLVGHVVGSPVFSNLYYDNTIETNYKGIKNEDKITCYGLPTEVMQSAELLELLGDPFELAEDNYPYIIGLVRVGETTSYVPAGNRLTIGALTNETHGKDSHLRFYKNYDGISLKNSITYAEANSTIYVELRLGRRMLLTDGSLKVVNEKTNQPVTLTSVRDNVFSFTMPDAPVTVTASFHRDPTIPALWDGTIADAFAEGDGSKDDPYLIHDGSELAYLALLCNANSDLTTGRYYKVVNDIVLNEDVLTDEFDLDGEPDNQWTPIGKDKNHSFHGFFEGDNHYISGMYIINGGGTNNPGMFGFVDGGTIQNLSLIDSYIRGFDPGALVNTLAQSDSARISRCYVEARTSTTSGNSYWAKRYASNLVYSLGAKGIIEHCYTSGKLSDGGTLSGLVISQTNGGVIRNCYTAATGAYAVSQSTNNTLITNVYYNRENSGATAATTTKDDFRSVETVEMLSTDFAEMLGEPFVYVLGNYPYIPGLRKIDEERGWTTPLDPSHSTAVVWKGERSITFASGNGTETDPYIINNADQLHLLAKLTNANGKLTKGKYYKLGADVLINANVLNDDLSLRDFPFYSWEPIGQDKDHTFQGTFDGNGHSISGAYINGSTISGFFGYVNGGTVKNLSLIDSYFKCYYPGMIANLAVSDSSWVRNCYVEANCVGNANQYYYVSQLVNTLGTTGTVENCYVSGISSGQGNKAAIIGTQAGTAVVHNCFSTVKGATSIGAVKNYTTIDNIYNDIDLGTTMSNAKDTYCSKHTIEMHTTDFAAQIGEPFEYVAGNYPYIPGLLKIGENRGWKAPEDPTHGGAGAKWDGERAITFASGKGTKEDPYIINNGAQLYYLAKLTNANGKMTKGRYYRLGADIVLNDSVLDEDYELRGEPANVWEPIGLDKNNSFQGHLDGNNYFISGAYYVINNNGTNYPGLFSYVDGGSIRNLSVLDSYIKGSYPGILVGMLASTDSALVSHCYVDSRAVCSLSGGYYSNYYVSALVETLGAKGTIEYCYTTGKVSNAGNQSGLVCVQTNGGVIRNCYTATQGGGAVNKVGNAGLITNVYFDRVRSGATAASQTNEYFRSAEPVEMLSTDFAALLGEPYEYSLGYYPYFYGMPKIDKNGKTVMVNGYPMRLGQVAGGSDCTMEFYRTYTKKTKELSHPVEAGSRVFVDGTVNIYAKLGIAASKRLSDAGLQVVNDETGEPIDVSQVDYDLYMFTMPQHAVTVSAKFVTGGYCGNPEVNNGRDTRWEIVDNERLVISGVGEVGSRPWSEFVSLNRNIKAIDVDEGVTSLPEYAFHNTGIDGKEPFGDYVLVSLPSTLTKLSPYGFYYAYVSVDMSKCTKMTMIESQVLTGLMGEILVPATVNRISSNAFWGVTIHPNHLYVPVAKGEALFVNGQQQKDVNGRADIVATLPSYQLQHTSEEDLLLNKNKGYFVDIATSADGNMKLYYDAAATVQVNEGMKVVSQESTSRIYVKVNAKDTKILFVDGLTLKTNGGVGVAIKQEADDVFSFELPDDDMSISARFSTGGYCGENSVNNCHNLIWTLNNGTLSFQKNALAVGNSLNMGSWASGKAPWNTLGGSIKSVDLSGVKNIGNNAFSGCTKLVGLELPASPVITVGENAFAEQMVLIIPAESWNSYQDAGWSAYEEQTTRDKETFSMKDGQQWRTYYSKVGRTLPDGLKAYTIAGIGDAEVTTSEALDYIPAGQAVLIENRDKTACTAEAETSLLPYAQQNVPVCLLTTDEDNLLQWITEPMAVSAGDGYTLYKDEFVKVSTGTLPAGVAFLPAQGVAASRLFIFNGEDEETAIDRVQEAEDNAQWYTLDGKKLSGKPSARGIYLRDGQKVMVK